ncbi:MAG: dihydroorotate dehydrogenase electron transfer subunit [Phycisphaeraceae bacterium]|nr:dihydroorotate dehydrogenase electron transfer subunit [Phycisphaeraceae bacterium]
MVTGSASRSNAGRGLFAAKVEANQPVCREHFRLRLRMDRHATFPASRPGQFIQIGCRPPASRMDDPRLLGDDWDWSPGQPATPSQMELVSPLALLRRPFSLAGRWDDARGTVLEILHRVVGVGTQWLSALRPDDDVDLIGPLGNCFTMPEGNRIALLVGGGVGLPPMFYVAQTWVKQDFQAVAFIGAMTADLLPVSFTGDVPGDGRASLCAQPFSQWNVPSVVTTDDGSRGLKGLITDGLRRHLDRMTESQRGEAVLLTCGPHRMMHAVAKLGEQFGVPVQACMEQAMACGMGTCQSCVVKMEDREKPQGTTSEGRPWRYKLACTDGPVFAAERVVW